MIIRNIPGTVKCPECGSRNIDTKWSITTIVAWLGKLLGIPTVKIFGKRCVECGKEVQIIRE
jgi:predicted nucleic-acid-binding Zn-ribbon protein